MQKDITTMTEAPGASVPTQDEVQALLRQAEQGDRTVLPALRAHMDLAPSLWAQRGDLAQVMQQMLIGLVASTNLVVQENIARKCAALTQELVGPTPSPLECLLVERVVLCWLHLHYAEGLRLQTKEVTFQQEEFHQRRISKMHARYLSAIRTLAQVRLLGVPAVQVNIGQQQMIAG
jgi:hypothetical protein